jgi:hypothetical protein
MKASKMRNQKGLQVRTAIKAGDDLDNLDLQNTMQQQNQLFQMMSNILKSQHDAKKHIISSM